MNRKPEFDQEKGTNNSLACWDTNGSLNFDQNILLSFQWKPPINDGVKNL